MSLVLVILLITLAGTGSVSAIQNNMSADGNKVITDLQTDRVIIGFKEKTNTINGNLFCYAADTKESQQVENTRIIVVGTDNYESTIQELEQHANILFVEPDYPIYALEVQGIVPNDPLFAQQWSLQNTGVSAAWEFETGSKDIKIAIIDTGIDYNHPDLSNYVDGGYDWVNDDPDPMDDHGHGSHCAGIAASTMGNGIGIAGISQSSLMAEKVLNESGAGYSSSLASGIIHAADMGANIISLSLASTESSAAVEDACNYAWSKGCIIVAASGNTHDSISYPAAFDPVIAVGSIGPSNELSSFSNFGYEQELVAPGENILSTVLNNSYENKWGTSMAAPHVAGIAALVLSRYPDMSNNDMRVHLTDTAEDLGAEGWDETYGYGKVNAFEALAIYIPDTFPTIQDAVNNVTNGSTIIVRPGTYTENVIIDRELKIIAGSENISDTFVMPEVANEPVFSVKANNVTIRGFSITDNVCNSNAGVSLDNVMGCNIAENEIGNMTYGILLSNSSSNNVVLNRIISHGDSGICVTNTSNNNTLANNTISAFSYCGIILNSSCYNLMTNNTVTLNDAGIRFVNSGNNTLYNNIITSNYYGVNLNRSDDNQIYDNYFNNENNALDDGYNVWNHTEMLGMNIVQDVVIGGNFWHDYEYGGSLPYNCSGQIVNGGDYLPLDPNPWNDISSAGEPDGSYITIGEVIDAYNCWRLTNTTPKTGASVSIGNVIDMYNAWRFTTAM
jgi:parallel beta-helix repeat protein